MHDLFKIYYLITAYLPRKLPSTKEELSHIRYVLTHYYGLEDRSDIWLTIFGNLTSRPAISLWFYYGQLNAVGRRMDINKLLHQEKLIEIKKLEDRLEELTKRAQVDEQNRATMQKGTPDLQGNLQSVQGSEEGVVSNPELIRLY